MNGDVRDGDGGGGVLSERPVATSDASQEASAQPPTSLAGLSLGNLGAGVLELAKAQPNLRVLDLKDSKIPAVPGVVYRSFAHVQCLDLRKNSLEELVPDIAAMTALEDLLVDQNRLKSIPSEVCMLPKMRVLSAGQNCLKSLPRAIGSMENLKTLTLGDNCLEEVPAEIGGCRALQTLFAHHNRFTRLPTTICQLEGLSEIALEWFRYTTPPLPRVIKGAEWKRSIQKLLDICKEKRERGEPFITCIEVLTQFSQKAFDPNAVDSKRRTRLHVACLEGHVGVASALAESGSKVDSLDNESYSALLVAVREEQPEIAEALVRVGADVSKGGGLFGSPLHVATVNFDPNMVNLLIRGKADVNQTDADGNTPLHVLMSVFDKGGGKACAIGQILLRQNADCNKMNGDKWAPLHLAARRGQLRGICFVLVQIDGYDKSEAASKPKPKSGRALTCSKVFDLNLRGGSHLWSPLHLAGHACNANVVQVLIEAGANVFLRNIDSRTARHVSRGNLAISKLLRKAEDEWLWHRLHSDADGDMAEKADGPKAGAGDDATIAGSAKVAAPGASAAPVLAEDPTAPERQTIQDPPNRQVPFGPEDEVADLVEAIARRIERATTAPREAQGGSSGSAGPTGGFVPTRGVNSGVQRLHRVMEKCQDSHLSKAELQQMQIANFSIPLSGIEEFIAVFATLVQQGPKHRLPFLLSKPWAKELMLKLFEDEQGHGTLLQPSVVANEDVVRLLISNLPRDRLVLFGKIRNKDRETWLHLLCKGQAKASSAGSRADILSLLLAVCPPLTFDFEAIDHRGQTALHLAAQCGDIGLVQVLLEAGADPNAQEETTGWTPLHFAVSTAHYALILQLLHHETANVNQVDKFDWPPLFEACSRLDQRSTSLLVNAGADLSFRNQHDFDVLKAVDTSKKDLPAKRWMSCLMVSNGFRFEDSTVQLNREDRETLERERAFFQTRSSPSSLPPFYVPDHLAPRCQSCKVLFSGITVRRNHCRSCGLVLCPVCTISRPTTIVALDERLGGRRPVAVGGRPEPGAADGVVEGLMQRGGAKPTPPVQQPGRGVGAAAASPQPASQSDGAGGSDANSSEDSFEEAPAEELPDGGPPASNVGPVTNGGAARVGRTVRGSLVRERGSVAAAASGSARVTKLCAPCAAFHEVGVGETYSMLQRRGC